MTRYNILNPKHTYACGREHVTFHDYYSCHCNNLARTSTGLYYIGVFFLLTTAGIVTYARFDIKFQVQEAGVIFCVILGVFLVSLAMFEYIFPTGMFLDAATFGALYKHKF